MTDRSAPLPRPRSDLTEPPDAVGARDRPDSLNSLQGRMLIQVSTARLGYVQGQVDLARSGLILCGTDAVKKAVSTVKQFPTLRVFS